ncbi:MULTISPECIES: hypothetical protein [unclassified Ornithinimicrobium]|uniref:hypothetical protein n=1 Tax=unclassified Ornithinimicrobium TaxID=2615080 RepID=UPI0038549159
MKAHVAIQHAMLTVIWHMLSTGQVYEDLGSDYYTRRRPERAKNRAVAQFQALGYTVTLDTAEQQPSP